MSNELKQRENDRTAILNRARRLQEHLLPQKSNDLSLVNAILYRPADTMAGDYYDIFPQKDGAILICIVDVCGHGVAAAMGTAILKTLLFSASEQYSLPSDILEYINKRFFDVSLSEDFASMVLVRLDPSGHKLMYASAGHEPCYILRDNNTLEKLNSTGTILGISVETIFENRTMMFSSTDSLILLTDGVTEASNHKGRYYGRTRLTQHLLTLAELPPDTITREIIADLDNYCGDTPRADDQTIVVLQLPKVPAEQRNKDEVCSSNNPGASVEY